MALPCGAAPFVKVFLKSIFGRVGGQIFLDHQRHLKDDGIIEVAQVKAGQLADLLKAVDQRVAVNEQTAARLGDVQVVLKEALDREQRLGIEGVDALLLEHLAQECLAERRRQLVDQARNAQMVIADDLTLGVKHLADLHGNLGFLKAGGQVFDVADGRTDADDGLDVMVALQRIDDRGSQLFHIAGVVVGLDLLDQDGVGLADVKDEVLLFVREKTADDVVGGNIIAGGHADQQYDALHVGDKVQLPRLGVDVAGQDIVEHDVLDEVRLVEFFVVVLLDALQADGEHGGELLGGSVSALDKDGVVIVLGVGELMVGIPIAHESIPGRLADSGHALAHLTDLSQLRAGNDGAGLINHADDTIHCVLHLVDHVLEYPVCHNM